MRDIHIMPTTDIRDHVESISCWCKPKIINKVDVIKGAEIVISHNRFLESNSEQEEYLM